NFVVNTDQTLATVEIGPGDATPVFLPFFHIYGLMCLMHLAVIAGGKIVTMPRFDLAEFLRLIEEHRARALWVVPPVAIALAKHPLVAEFDLSSVEYVNSAAAPLGAETAEALAARLGCVVAQGYGMTELSPVVAISRTDAHRSGASGRLVPNTELRIVDPETGADRAPGEEGEVIVRGPQVMKGYLGNPEATAGTIDADGWLHTGDIGVMDADGYLHIRDRVKELIKVKGFQVAPAELEAVLLELPAVADAAVIGVPDEEAGERPVAFVVAASGAAAEAEPLMAHLDARLSHYKQLSAVHFVDAIPKSASGKILRRVLRAEHAG
ncbi:MAG: AMP-binding protein, partial [Pseudomonadota bacterium]